MRLAPPDTHDLSVFGGRLYLYRGPFPALLLVPFVWLQGVGFSDLGFTVVLGAVDVALVASLLRAAMAERWLVLDRYRRGALVTASRWGRCT